MRVLCAVDANVEKGKSTVCWRLFISFVIWREGHRFAVWRIVCNDAAAVAVVVADAVVVVVVVAPIVSVRFF